MERGRRNWRNDKNNDPLSLAPLTFEEAVTDILKIRPMPKGLKKKPQSEEAGKLAK